MDCTTAPVISSADLDRRLCLPAGSAYLDDDCACETSNVALPPIAALAVDGAPLQRYPGLYQDDQTIANQRIVFNPLVGIGVLLLTPAAATVLDLVDGHRSWDAVCRAADLLVGGTAAAESILARLVAERVIFTGSTPPLPQHGAPRHLGIWLHVTNQCNLRCTYCYVSKTISAWRSAGGARLSTLFSSPPAVRALRI